MSSRKLLVILLAMVFIIGAVGSARASSDYVGDFTTAYPGSATSSFSCSICHTSEPTRNPYGAAWRSANYNFTTIESQDSDGDGATNIVEINAGTNPGSATSKPTTPTPVTCTDYTYSAWSACGANGQQTRTVTGSTPAGCSGTPSTAAVLTQACTSAPVACTDYTYSAWSACGANGQQSRTVTANTPSGCTGTPSTFAVLTQACTPMSSGMMPMPTSQMMFLYDPSTDPVIGSAPEDSIPMGVGSVAVGGGMLTIHAEIGQFQMPMDIYFALYAPLVDPFNIYLINQAGDLQPVSMGMSPWITDVTSIDEMPFGADIPTSMLPEGTYYLGLMATPAGSNMETYYFWVTNFIIQ